MSALTDKIAREHGGYGVGCTCGSCPDDDQPITAWRVTHIAQVAEAAVREQVARDIEANYLGPDFGRNPINGQDSPHAMHAEAYDEGLADAARIARGGAA